jgi:sigma-E factor negative regulatory protein RseB
MQLMQELRLKNKLFYIFAVLFMPAIVLADTAAVEAWLQKMHNAAHMSNFTGKFVYQQDSQLSLMRIIHAADGDGEHERLISLDEIGREVIRSRGVVTCILPDSKSVVVEKGRPKQQFPPAFPMKIKNLQSYYQFVLDRQERVAGRTAQKIVIKPNDRFLYGHNLWVDHETGLLLKSHLVDEKGNLLEQFMFTEIEFKESIPKEMLKPRITGETYTWHEAKQPDTTISAENGDAVWSVDLLPAGFNSDMKRRHHMPNQKTVRHLVFTDGLASVSVFIEKHQASAPNLVGASRMGAVNAFGRLVNDHHVTAVGEVPRATVQMITRSVRYNAK